VTGKYGARDGFELSEHVPVGIAARVGCEMVNENDRRTRPNYCNHYQRDVQAHWLLAAVRSLFWQSSLHCTSIAFNAPSD